MSPLASAGVSETPPLDAEGRASKRMRFGFLASPAADLLDCFCCCTSSCSCCRAEPTDSSGGCSVAGVGWWMSLEPLGRDAMAVSVGRHTVVRFCGRLCVHTVLDERCHEVRDPPALRSCQRSSQCHERRRSTAARPIVGASAYHEASEGVLQRLTCRCIIMRGSLCLERSQRLL